MPGPAVELPELVVVSGDPLPDAASGKGSALQTWRDHAGRLVATGGRVAGAWWMDWPELATFWFGPAGPVRATTTRRSNDPQVKDIFIRGVTPVVLVTRGDEALHASAVACDDGTVVALCAASGTGKSTMAYAMAVAGARHFADDTLLYRFDGGRPMAIRLPFPTRVDENVKSAVGRAPGDWLAWTGGEGRPLKRVYQLLRDDGAPARAPAFRAIDPVASFEILLSHAHPAEMGGPARQRAFIEHVMALARQTEVWECRFTPSLEALPDLAAQVLNHAVR